MWIVNNISQDADGKVYAGQPTYFGTEEAAINSAREQLADDFGITVEEVEEKAYIGGTPSVLSISVDGRTETYIVAKAKDTKVPLVTHYSFDSEVPVFLFDSEEAAIKELKSQFDEELRIQTEENGHVLDADLETDVSSDGRWASITIYYDDQKDVIEWSIGTVKEAA